jgi:hypothetical protein
MTELNKFKVQNFSYGHETVKLKSNTYKAQQTKTLSNEKKYGKNFFVYSTQPLAAKKTLNSVLAGVYLDPRV